MPLFKDDKKFREALAIAVEADCCIVHHRTWLYRSATGEYTLLKFDHNSNVLLDKEENFPDINDAISKFIQQGKGKI
jgi:hypothetical protein